MALVERLTSYVLPWTGDEGYKKAEVTGGGVALDEVDRAHAREPAPSPACSCAAKCSTPSARSAATTSPGPGRRGGWPGSGADESALHADRGHWTVALRTSRSASHVARNFSSATIMTHGSLLRRQGPGEVLRRRQGRAGALGEIPRLVLGGVRRRRADRTREGAHRARRRARRAVPVLHRRLHVRQPRERRDAGADDRSRARRGRHPRRRVARARRADAQPRRRSSRCRRAWRCRRCSNSRIAARPHRATQRAMLEALPLARRSTTRSARAGHAPLRRRRADRCCR